MLNKIPERNRRIFLLAISIGIGQGIVVLASPILTRLYTPTDFGILSAYVSLIGIFSAFVGLKFEMAIPLPKSDDDGRLLVWISIGTTLIVTAVIIFSVELLHNFLARFELISLLWPLRWTLPIGVVLVGTNQTLTYWAIRQSDYKSLAATKIYQGWLSVLVQVILHYFGAVALLIGDMLGRAAGSIRLTRNLFNHGKSNADHQQVRRDVVRLIHEYRKFPLLSSGSGLINSLGQNVAPLMFLSAFGPGIVGSFALVQRVFAAPAVTIGQAASQVFYGEIARNGKDNAQGLQKLIIKQLKMLTMIGLVFFMPVCIFAEWGFSVIFSGDWRIAGQIGSILSIFYFFQFVVSPISQVFNVLNRQDVQFAWDIFRLIFIVVGVVISISLNWGVIATVWVYSITGALSYVLLLVMVYFIVFKKNSAET